jgi:hypothetical protein
VIYFDFGWIVIVTSLFHFLVNFIRFHGCTLVHHFTITATGGSPTHCVWKTDAVSKLNVLSCCTRGRIFNAGVYNAPLAQCCLNNNVFQFSSELVELIVCVDCQNYIVTIVMYFQYLCNISSTPLHGHSGQNKAWSVVC